MIATGSIRASLVIPLPEVNWLSAKKGKRSTKTVVPLTFE
jgi:hypothetical protein